MLPIFERAQSAKATVFEVCFMRLRLPEPVAVVTVTAAPGQVGQIAGQLVSAAVVALLALQHHAGADHDPGRIAVITAEQIALRQVVILRAEISEPVIGVLRIRRGRAAAVDHEHVVVVVRIHLVRGADLAQVAEAGGRPGLLARLVQRGQQHRRENRDDRDNDEELDEGERSETEEPAESLHFSVLCVARTIVHSTGRHGVRLLRLRDSHGFSP